MHALVAMGARDEMIKRNHCESAADFVHVVVACGRPMLCLAQHCHAVKGHIGFTSQRAFTLDRVDTLSSAK